MKRRLLSLLAAAFLLVGVVALWIFFHWARPVGSGPAGPALPREIFRQAWTQRDVLLVGFGDSVTAGFGARKGYGYFDRLVENPADEFADIADLSLSKVIPRLQFINLAVSGTTSMEHIEKQLPKFPVASSNTLGMVAITTGGNDVIHNYGRTPPREEAMYGATWDQAQPWIANFENRLRRILAEVETRFPGGCFIFLANIYDPTDGVGDIQRTGLPKWEDGLKILQAYNIVVRKVANELPNVHMIDIHQAFLGHGIHCTRIWHKHYDRHDPHYWYHVNLEDPNERGYDAIRRLFLLEMARVSPQFN